MRKIEAIEILFQVFGVSYRVYTEDTTLNPEQIRDKILMIWGTAHLYSVSTAKPVDVNRVKEFHLLTAITAEKLGDVQG